MAFTGDSYKDLTYEEALAVLDGKVSIIDPALIFAAREKAKRGSSTGGASITGALPFLYFLCCANFTGCIVQR